jgi:hypothetical protein
VELVHTVRTDHSPDAGEGHDGGVVRDGIAGGHGQECGARPHDTDDGGDVVNEAVGGGTDTVIASTSWSMAAGQEIEILVTSEPTSTQAIDLGGNEFANRIEGNAGPNTLLQGNLVQCGINNEGDVCTDVFDSPTGGGGFWPSGTTNQYIFNSGLQIAGINSAQAGPWATHPKRMLRHKAMIQCARIAFSFAGIYDQDEAERIIEATVVDVTADETAPEIPAGTQPERGSPRSPWVSLDRGLALRYWRSKSTARPVARSASS